MRGLSRSGGTLLVTLLDASSEMAMSYELYPNLLEDSRLSSHEIEKTIELLKPHKGRGFAKAIEGSLATYLNRLHRGGVSPADAIDLLEAHVKSGLDFTTSAACFAFMGRCADLKRCRELKPRWGMKCLNNYADYLQAYPFAKFLNMVRDPRDVLASSLKNQMRNRTIDSVATGWINTHTKFEEMEQIQPNTFKTVIYEDLVTRPRQTLVAICEFLEMDFEQDMLSHENKNLTIFSASHLSKERVASGIDSSSIGRWREDLGLGQVEELESLCASMMGRYGYKLYR